MAACTHTETLQEAVLGGQWCGVGRPCRQGSPLASVDLHPNWGPDPALLHREAAPGVVSVVNPVNGPLASSLPMTQGFLNADAFNKATSAPESRPWPEETRSTRLALPPGRRAWQRNRSKFPQNGVMSGDGGFPGVRRCAPRCCLSLPSDPETVIVRVDACDPPAAACSEGRASRAPSSCPERGSPSSSNSSSSSHPQSIPETR